MPGVSEEGQSVERAAKQTHRGWSGRKGRKDMAKILMMAGSAVVVLSLLGFLVLFLKERATGKTSPVLQALKAAGIRAADDAPGTTFFPGIAETYRPETLAAVPAGASGGYRQPGTPYQAPLPDLVAAVPDGVTVALRCGGGGYQDLCHCGRHRAG